MRQNQSVLCPLVRFRNVADGKDNQCWWSSKSFRIVKSPILHFVRSLFCYHSFIQENFLVLTVNFFKAWTPWYINRNRFRLQVAHLLFKFIHSLFCYHSFIREISCCWHRIFSIVNTVVPGSKVLLTGHINCSTNNCQFAGRSAEKFQSWTALIPKT